MGRPCENHGGTYVGDRWVNCKLGDYGRNVGGLFENFGRGTVLDHMRTWGIRLCVNLARTMGYSGRSVWELVEDHGRIVCDYGRTV